MQKDTITMTPTFPMEVEGRKVIRIICEPNTEDIRIRKAQRSELGKSRRRSVKHMGTNKIYQSLIEAARAHNVSASSISRVCKGKQLTTQGHKFEYIGENND